MSPPRHCRPDARLRLAPEKRQGTLGPAAYHSGAPPRVLLNAIASCNLRVQHRAARHRGTRNGSTRRNVWISHCRIHHLPARGVALTYSERPRVDRIESRVIALMRLTIRPTRSPSVGFIVGDAAVISRELPAVVEEAFLLSRSSMHPAAPQAGLPPVARSTQLAAAARCKRSCVFLL
jgi:hypothetical protein